MQVHRMIEEYYAKKIQKYGATPQGVDWNGEDSQFIGFEQLSKIISTNKSFSIGDIGCGYGKYFEFLQNRFDNFSYIGYDLSKEMVENAKKLYGDKKKGGGNSCKLNLIMG